MSRLTVIHATRPTASVSVADARYQRKERP
jgi:hypothetical protein